MIEKKFMKENLFLALGIQTREDCVSNAIAYAINVSPGFRKEFLKEFCKIDVSKYQSVRAYTRISAGTSGIPDIIIGVEKDSTIDLIIIENKLKAEEGVDQTKRYSSQQAIEALMNKLFSGKVLGNVFFIFITLFPDQKPSSPQYSEVKHFDLIKIFDKVNRWESPLAEKLIHDWCELVKSFYEKNNIALSDIFYDKLKYDSGLDAGYLYFRKAMTHLNLPYNLQVEGFFRSSQQGRHYYGAIISKDSWHPSEMYKVEGKWELDPHTCFNIHFEPQYNVLTEVFNCYLHYEINPYETQQWVEKNIPKHQYEEYKKRRNKFVSLLSSKNLPNWLFGGGSNQIAKIIFDFKNKTYEEVKNTLEYEIGKMAKVIDDVLEQI